MKDRSLGILDEKPIFDIELHIARKIEEKSLFILKKRKKKLIKKIK